MQKSLQFLAIEAAQGEDPEEAVVTSDVDGFSAPRINTLRRVRRDSEVTPYKAPRSSKDAASTYSGKKVFISFCNVCGERSDHLDIASKLTKCRKCFGHGASEKRYCKWCGKLIEEATARSSACEDCLAIPNSFRIKILPQDRR